MHRAAQRREDEMAATRDDVLSALARVNDPASGKSIVDAGLVQGLVLRDGHVGFSIEVAPERGRASEPLRKAAEDAVNA
jgi:ATP-binding protein involved in chromosome partitioning